MIIDDKNYIDKDKRYTFYERNGKDCYVYKVYLGSSKMDTKEMNELIEITMQVCNELGIDTREEWYESRYL